MISIGERSEAELLSCRSTSNNSKLWSLGLVGIKIVPYAEPYSLISDMNFQMENISLMGFWEIHAHIYIYINCDP